MTDPLSTALKEHSEGLLRRAVLPPSAVIVQRGRQRRRRRSAVPAAAATVLAAAGLAAFIPQLSGTDSVRVPPPDSAGPAAGPEAEMFGDDLVAVSGGASDHVSGSIVYPDYPSRPPLVGEHAPRPQECGVYADAIAPEHAVHSLEHGAAWVTYRPDLPAPQVERLSRLVAGQPHRLMSPLPGQESAVVLTAWSRQLAVQNADDPRVETFLDYYTNGPQTPEKGAACIGVTVTGTAVSR